MWKQPCRSRSHPPVAAYHYNNIKLIYGRPPLFPSSKCGNQGSVKQETTHQNLKGKYPGSPGKLLHPPPKRGVLLPGRSGPGPELPSCRLGLVKQAHIPFQAGQFQLGQPMLPGAEEIPRAPSFKSSSAMANPVGGGGEGFRPLSGQLVPVVREARTGWVLPAPPGLGAGGAG